MVSGCGGDSSTATPPKTDPAPPTDTKTPAQLAAEATQALDALKQAIDAVMDDSETSVVTRAEGELTKARTAVAKVPAAERVTLSRRLGTLESDLTGAKDSRTGAMRMKANRMRAEAEAVYAGIARYNDASSSDERRYAQFNDQGNELSETRDPAVIPNLSIDIGQADSVRLTPDTTTMVEKLKGWTGSKWKLESGGATYEAVVYDNRYSAPGNRLRDAWSAEFDEATGWLNGTGTVSVGQHQEFDGFEVVAGINKLAKVGESYQVRGTFAGVPGEYHCTPAINKYCAVEARLDGLRLGELEGASFVVTNTAWRFKPDNMDDKVRSDRDPAFVTYGYWIKKSANGKWDVSAFHNNHRGPNPTAISGLDSDTKLVGTVTYKGGAAGVYALSDEAGTFTADAELVADFTANSARVPGSISVTGTIDGFMTKGFTGGDGMSRDWSVELQKLQISASGSFVTNASNNANGLTSWTMGGTAALAAGKWEGAFYERGGAGLRPKTATGSFYAEHGTNSRLVGAFGVTDPNTDEPLVE